MYYGQMMWILLPAIILTGIAQMMVKSRYNQYLQVYTKSNYKGHVVARAILDKNGLSDVDIEMVGGQLSDHYDPRSKTVRLSNYIYNTSSVAANAVAAHEVGHAIQHAKGYYPLVFRNNLLPVVNFTSRSAVPLFMIGFLFSSFRFLMDIGILFYAVVVLFHLVTLPLEFNASHRAMQELQNMDILHGQEVVGARKMLTAAALTYVASAMVSMAQLIRLIALKGSGNRRN